MTRRNGYGNMKNRGELFNRKEGKRGGGIIWKLRNMVKGRKEKRKVEIREKRKVLSGEEGRERKVENEEGRERKV